ncbi:hypothetical protein GCM10011609_29330 [Lentzea pudingi]|uniref:Helix-turn-helix domain-containing protein n=1 Tax=Lentzea pudingi TaxID=1789439 RepID=A0ABQ2HWS5_9PSEU|nr:hypothetical protein GCM10011609_29330 [Lentzea pudingi]
MMCGKESIAIRAAALRQLVLQTPAPLIADALGFHSKHVTRIWADAGGVWTRLHPRRSQPVRFTVEYQPLDQWSLSASRANSCGRGEAENARVYPQPKRTICLGQV